MALAHQQLWLSMLKKNARLEIMYQRGFRPSHAVWIDTYNKQFGEDIIYAIQSGVSSRNHYYVAVELWYAQFQNNIMDGTAPKHKRQFVSHQRNRRKALQRD